MAVLKRSAMTLFSDASAMASHRVRMVLAEKAVSVDVIAVDPANPPEDLLEINPQLVLPTLVDRGELVLSDSRIAMEYLDERFPHPPLLPAYPVARAKSRILMHQIESDWYRLVDTIEDVTQTDDVRAKARASLGHQLTHVVPLFEQTPYFVSQEFSLVDCVLAPLCWRLPHLGVHLDETTCAPIYRYMDRVFDRMSFQASLTDYELEMRETDEAF